jgi:glycosyltransferase involved in cell wall biosynthesis
MRTGTHNRNASVEASSAADHAVDPPGRRICLVTGELSGPDYNGGIGTANRGLALALRRHGYQVDVLYTRVSRQEPFCFRGTFEEQVEAYRGLGIRLLCIAHDGEWNDWLAKSHHAMTHLAAGGYDHVFFNDTHGTGYYPLLARRTGSPELARTSMAVVTHSATQWVAELNQSAITSVEDVRLLEMERRSIELADAVISPSAYLLDKYRGYGWQLPENTVVLPNLLPDEDHRRPLGIRHAAVEELVFFGRLERRKGLWLFCEALDRIKYQLKERKVTFLGRVTQEDGEATSFSLVRRSAAWPFEVRLLHGFDREQALNYLKTGPRLAVMPSWQDNSPCAILECLHNGIPFIASSGSGGQELLAAACRDDNLFEPTVDALCRKLRSALDHGAATALPASDPDRNEASLMRWLEGVLSDRQGGPVSQAVPQAAKAAATKPEGARSVPRLLLIATANLAPKQAASRIERVAALHAGSAEITVLAEDPTALAAELRSGPVGAAGSVVDIRRYAEAVASVADPSAVVAICHVSQPISPAWIERARTCLEGESGITALTGLVALEAPPPRELPSFVSVGDTARKVKRYLIGNSPALFLLGQETNSGFLALRGEALAAVEDIPPHDPQYDRAKRMGDWIHEIVVRLQARGRRFEVLPDHPLDRTVEEAPSPVFRLGGVLRSLAGSQLGYLPGSEPALLSRLAIDIMIEPEKRSASAECLSYAAEKLGRPLDGADLPGSPDETYRMLSTMAQACGQTELALDLLTESLTDSLGGGTPTPTSLAALVRRRSSSIRLYDLAAARSFVGLNLSHEWSFKIFEDAREIEIHPNSSHEGRAGMTYLALDLAPVERLSGAVRLAAPTARPVCFRLSIAAVDGSHHFGVEHVVKPGAVIEIDEVLPQAARQRCNVTLATEMADPLDSPRDAWARWVDLSFTASDGDGVDGSA